MKVAYDSQIFIQQRYGGISRYFVEVIKRMNNLDGVVPKVIAPFYYNEYLSGLNEENLVGSKVENNSRLVKVLLNKTSRLVEPYLTRNFSPDIIHETYFLQKKKKDAKHVITVHDMIHEKFESAFHKSDPTTRKKKDSVTRSDHIICVSECTKLDLIEYYNVDPQKISVIYHGVSLDASGVECDIKIDGSFILYVGQRHTYKNFMGLLEAFALFQKESKDFKLISFGGPSFTKVERDRIKDLGLNGVQVIHMQGDDSLLAQLYKNASLFVYPSLYEGFGIPPLEAMSQGCPVICSDIKVFHEILADATTYFDPESPESIKCRMKEILFSDEQGQRLREKGLRHVKKFSWDRAAQETLNVYRNLM